VVVQHTTFLVGKEMQVQANRLLAEGGIVPQSQPTAKSR
jgi:hypothetical protein